MFPDAGAPRRGRMIVALGIGIVTLLALVHLARQRMSDHAGDRASAASDRVLIVEGASRQSQRAVRSSLVDRVATGAKATDLPPTTRAAVIRALRVSTDARFSDIRQGDGAGQILCGTVTLPTVPPRQFVYLGAAGLGAIDDHGAQFAAMRDRLCRLP